MGPGGRWVRAAHAALSSALLLGLLLHRTGEAGPARAAGRGGRGRAGPAPPPGAGGGRGRPAEGGREHGDGGRAVRALRDTGCLRPAAARGCPEGRRGLGSPFSASPLSAWSLSFSF